MNKSTFCILPFSHLYVEPTGEIKPCCISNSLNDESANLNNNNICSAYNVDSLKQLRSDLVNGIKNDICSTCWQREMKGSDSLRIHSNSQYGYEYKMSEDGHVNPNFTNIDIRFSNLCNFKCIMCGPWLSSSHWGETEKKLGIPKVVSIKDNIIEELSPYIKNLKHIYFGGGEPLIMPEHYKMLKYLHDNNKNITIKYTTNLSVIKHDVYDLIEMWSNFKGVQLQISVDGLYEKGENIRVGFNTEKFLENIEVLKKNNIFYTLSYTTGSHNIFDIYEFIDNVFELGIVDSENKIELHNYVTSPEKYSLNNMSNEDKIRATNYLLSRVDSLKTNFLKKEIYNLVKFLGIQRTNKLV